MVEDERSTEELKELLGLDLVAYDHEKKVVESWIGDIFSGPKFHGKENRVDEIVLVGNLEDSHKHFFGWPVLCGASLAMDSDADELEGLGIITGKRNLDWQPASRSIMEHLTFSEMTCQHGGEDGRGTLHDARLNLDLVGSPTEDEDDISIGSDALKHPFLSGEASPGRRIVASFALVGGTRRAHV
jgi:hypothetical protein